FNSNWRKTKYFSDPNPSDDSVFHPSSVTLWLLNCQGHLMLTQQMTLTCQVDIKLASRALEHRDGFCDDTGTPEKPLSENSSYLNIFLCEPNRLRAGHWIEGLAH
ncbi:hypothetical protein STEG23_000787, partial [Scotinomys teguina]